MSVAKFEVECRGTQGPTLVLLAGGTDGVDVWAPIVERLGDGRTCTADLRVVASGGRAEMVPSVAAGALAAGLTRAGVERCFLVAHSLGGLTVRSFGAMFPGRVLGAVLLDPTVPWFIDGTAEDREAFARGGWNPEASRAEAEAASRWPIDVPVVVLSHDAERAVTTGSESVRSQRQWSAGQAEYASLVPHGTQREVANAGHYLHTEAPDAVVAAIRGALDESKRHCRSVCASGRPNGWWKTAGRSQS